MARVFISHSSSDRDFVEQELLPALNARGIDAWYSPIAIQTAEQWERSIRQGLELCEWFLLVMSPRSAASKWVRTELFWAFEKRYGRIIPVFLETCDPTDLHLMLNEIQFVDFREDRKDGCKKLIATFELGLAPSRTESQQPEETPDTSAQTTSTAPEEVTLLHDDAQAIPHSADSEKSGTHCLDPTINTELTSLGAVAEESLWSPESFVTRRLTDHEKDALRCVAKAEAKGGTWWPVHGKPVGGKGLVHERRDDKEEEFPQQLISLEWCGLVTSETLSDEYDHWDDCTRIVELWTLTNEGRRALVNLDSYEARDAYGE